jgi:hypothetical protein
MNPLLKWQYDQLLKELLLLQEHQADPSCPCESKSEMCVRKHLLIIEAYAQETAPMEEKDEYKQKLLQLADEARRFRKEEEVALLGESVEYSFDALEWPRTWRKAFEAYSLGAE